uniref:hypothetical protein n=1 Tax=Segatella hominis TaxID=2518605 RepID=UPI004024C611
MKVPKASANNPFFIILCVLSFYIKSILFFRGAKLQKENEKQGVTDWIFYQKKQIVDGRRNKYPFFSQYRWVTGVTAPSTKKQKTRVTGVTQQTGSNKRLG